MADNRYLLQSELHQQIESGFLATGYKPLITGSLDSGNGDDAFFIKNHIGREWFRRLAHHGLNSYITDPYDAGYRPLTITGLYYGGSSSVLPGAPLDASTMLFWFSAQAVHGVADGAAPASVTDFANGGSWAINQSYGSVKYIESSPNFDGHPSIQFSGGAGVFAALSDSYFSDNIVSGCSLFVVWNTVSPHAEIVTAKNDTTLAKSFHFGNGTSTWTTYGTRTGVMWGDTETTDIALYNDSFVTRVDFNLGAADLADITRTDGAAVNAQGAFGPASIPTSTTPQSGNADTFIYSTSADTVVEISDIIMFGPSSTTSDKAVAEGYFYTGYAIAPAP